MEKIRKYLIIVFACITIALSIITICDKYDETNYYAPKIEQLKAQWGLSLEAQARKESKLVFFKVDDGSPLDASKEALDILKKDYLMTNLTRLKFPADYAILNYIIDNNRTSNKKVKAGILCPSLYPVYLTVSQTRNLNETAPDMSEAIIIASEHFKDDPKFVRTIAKNSDMLIDAPETPKYPATNGLSFLKNQSSKLLFFFTNPNVFKQKPAVISENARLANKIAQKFSDNKIAIAAKESAYQCLYTLLVDRMQTLEDKLLYVRALCEFKNVSNANRINYQLDVFAKKISTMRNKNGFVAEFDMQPTVRNNALCISILLKIAEITKKDLYRTYAIKIAEKLLLHFKENGCLKSYLTSEITQASSLEYILVAKAFYEISKLQKPKKWYYNAKRVVRYWDDHFMLDNNLWAVNSDKSTFAKYIRPVITRDAEHPSYIGEASQLFSEFKISKTKTFDKLRRLSFNATATVYADNKNWASLKLATFNYY